MYDCWESFENGQPLRATWWSKGKSASSVFFRIIFISLSNTCWEENLSMSLVKDVSITVRLAGFCVIIMKIFQAPLVEWQAWGGIIFGMLLFLALTHSCLKWRKKGLTILGVSPYNTLMLTAAKTSRTIFAEILKAEANLAKYLKEKSWSEHYKQLFFKYFQKSSSIY